MKNKPENTNTCGDDKNQAAPIRMKAPRVLTQVNAEAADTGCQDTCCTFEKPSAPSAVSDIRAVKPLRALSFSSAESSAPGASVPEKAEPASSSGLNGVVLDYRVSGMDCPSCATTIVHSLTQMSGVTACNINFSTGTMQVSLSEPDRQSEVEKAVQKLGFQAEALRQDNGEEYLIQGMDCGACAVSLEKHLKNTEGVEVATVSFATGKMHVRHSLTVEQIIAEVKKAGYQAQPLSNGQSGAAPGRFNGLTGVILSAIALTTGFVLSHLSVPQALPTLLYATAIIVGGLKPFRSAWYAILSRSLDMNVLMSAATLGAAVIGQWLEGASVVFLFSLGTALQTRSIEKTRNSIRNLMSLAPETARVLRNGHQVNVPAAQVKLGETILIKPADRLPLDGVVLKGESGVNQAPITGESIPVDKAPGDEVYAGSINHNGALEVRVTRLTSDTALARIIHMVEEAQGRKSPTQSFVERFSALYTPLVFVAALLIMVAPPVLGMGIWADWFYRGLELLVVACPCALVISTPVAIVSAIGNAARHGILVKGGITLEKLGSIRALAFDKTGTLTEGRPRVTEWQAFSGDGAGLLRIALSIETHSTHPLAAAISAYAREQDVREISASAHEAIPGKGAVAVVNGEKWLAGNERLFSAATVSPVIRAKLDELKARGASLVLLGTEREIAGVFAIADAIRPTTLEALKMLRAEGMTHTLMLTGDNEGTAQTIAAEAGVESWRAELMPQDKVGVIEEWQRKGMKIAMVGDGINDAPALAAADIGIAMGGAGTDSAIETADVVLMSDRLEQLPHAFALSRLTSAIIRQNIIFSLAVKVVALALILPGWLTLWMAVLSDTGAALIVILNSLRLLRFRR